VPMQKLLKKDDMFFWDDDCQKGWDTQKKKMVMTPILVFMDWKKEFHVHVNVSCIALGVVLTHPGVGDIDHQISFANLKLSTAENKYSTKEHEGLAMVTKGRYILLGG